MKIKFDRSRRKLRACDATAPMAELRIQVAKRYGSRLPVSGQQPPATTKYERERDARRTA